MGRYVATFVILILFWAVLSGHFDSFHMTLGVICCAVVTLYSSDLLFHQRIGFGRRARLAIKFLFYIPWLIYQIFLANIHVAMIVLSKNPRLKLDPELVRYKAKLRDDLAKVTFANSITLTPATITVDIAGEDLIVHAIDRQVADDLNSGEMERRVRNVYEPSGGRAR